MQLPPLPERARRALTKVGVTAAGQLPPAVQRAINTARGIDTPRLVRTLRGTRPVVIAPHPDDELIGAGGAMHRHIGRGHPPTVIHLTSGENTAALLELPEDERAPFREEEALAAAASIGLDHSSVQFLRFPDGGIDPASDVQVAALARALVAAAPDLVYAPWPIDAHRDHKAAAALVSRALTSRSIDCSVALYEVWTPLAPTHIVNVTANIDAKLEGLRQYKSALGSVDYVHTARGLAAYRSSQGMHGEGYAEAFVVLDPAALADLISQISS